MITDDFSIPFKKKLLKIVYLLKMLKGGGVGSVGVVGRCVPSPTRLFPK